MSTSGLHIQVYTVYTFLHVHTYTTHICIHTQQNQDKIKASPSKIQSFQCTSTKSWSPGGIGAIKAVVRGFIECAAGSPCPSVMGGSRALRERGRALIFDVPVFYCKRYFSVFLINYKLYSLRDLASQNKQDGDLPFYLIFSFRREENQ